MSSEDKIIKWSQLLNEGRRKPPTQTNDTDLNKESRTQIERDYDRILFSTPVRRLADKTQVFPLEKNDSVRTRLTHSHEVSNLSRSIGTTLAFEYHIAKGVNKYQRNLPALLAAIGLVHDLGNPPFGHQGESAIRSWFQDHKKEVLDDFTLTEQQKQDFLKFEGNAQAFRLVTRLQLLNDDFGLNLTYATLAAMMKYPVGSDKIDKKIAAKKKHGYFASEQSIAKKVFEATGLDEGVRHPLAYVMEACDDIAYVVLDAEDAVKKGLASFSDLMSYLKHIGAGDEVINRVVNKSIKNHEDYRKEAVLSPLELNDISMQMFRVHAISELVRLAVNAFVENEEVILRGQLPVPLLEESDGERLRKALKEFSIRHAYNHRSVLRVELLGYNVIRRLMDIFWDAIINRDDASDASSNRSHPFSKFVYGRISENYRRIFEDPRGSMADFSVRYRECLLLTDMISGMTDSFALSLKEEFESLIGDYELVLNVGNK